MLIKYTTAKTHTDNHIHTLISPLSPKAKELLNALWTNINTENLFLEESFGLKYSVCS